ncbi:MAG TPA: PSD1 and planctomycete cytochrome C domain-containing protein [Tepidisphaeraceae bacterium]|nr:PSD1 and planctomycete cytochrome C domain-containing protein [Tepidisphaeraceae bacterium]
MLLVRASGMLVVLIVCVAARAAEPSGPRDAAGVLEAHCVACHNPAKTKGGLDLSTREGLIKGGESGRAVVVGNPDASLLIMSVRHQTDSPMPHKADKLADAQIALLAEWVKAGAAYERTLKAVETKPGGFAITEADRRHWAFRPVRAPAVPELSPAVVGATEIDRFVLRELRANGLSLSARADKRTLIRRVSLDLVGLPPTPAEVEAFVADWSPDAYEKLIDRLLASPHYGERWGRHWLDLARFAETDGFEHDAVRPHAWRYRDYVIRSFNADKPYDVFVKEQIAGDELWPDSADARVATGFALLGPDMVDSSDQVQRRLNTLNDAVDTAGLALLGLTIGCARCHDHKFEPLAQKDYYQLQAFFAPAKFVRDQPIPSAADRAAYDAAMAEYSAHPLVRELAAIEGPAREAVRRKKLAKLPAEAQAAHAVPEEQRNAEQANLVLETEDMVKVADKEIAPALAEPQKSRRTELLAEVRKLARPAELPKAMALVAGKPTKTFVLTRGEHTQPGEEVRPGFPTVVSTGQSRERRAELAAWVASPENPLTARVMVNRIWRHHFGRGLVATPSDFGVRSKPTHPELLDWLAGAFVKDGWSVKRMHKRMLLSLAYQQTSRPEGAQLARKVDPENKLYWRMNRLRLEGEVIRDSLLAVGGRLSAEKIGGPSVFPPLPDGIGKGAKQGWKVSADPADQRRRSVYIFAQRNLRFPFLEVFDAPDSNLSCPAREKSTTAPQSLALLNADEVMAAAKATAARLEAEAKSVEERVALAYRLTLGRPPTHAEMGIALEFLKGAPLSEFCRALFNVNEFVYAE